MIQNSAFLRWLHLTVFANYAEFALEIILSFRKCFSLFNITLRHFIRDDRMGLGGATYYYLLHNLHTAISLHTAVFIYTFSLLIGALTFLPAGLGDAEIAMMQFLAIYNVPSSIAVAVTIVIRLTTLWFSVILGILFLPRRQLQIKH